MAAIQRLERTQLIPITPARAWDFFSRPQNLAQITPAYMRFHITSPPVEHMYAGEVITYIIRPLLGIPVRWMTEITHVQEGRYFVDEQKKGPYALWHHQHHFEPVPGGVKMTDIVHYQLPLGILGTVAEKLFVERQLQDIFDFREKAVTALFGSL